MRSVQHVGQLCAGALQTASAIVLVPGPGDPGDCGVLPQPPLLQCVAQPLVDTQAAVTLASNPARVHLYTKEVAICSNPRAHLFQQHSLQPHAGVTSLPERCSAGLLAVRNSVL